MADDGKTASEVLAAQLPAIRARLDLSAQGLADRVAALGGTLDRAAISKIETGKRGVSLDEALLLALAADVAPVHLFLPREDAKPVRVAPKLSATAVAARRWLRGQEPLPGGDEKTFQVEVPASEWTRKRSQREIDAASRHAEADRRFRVAETLLGMLQERRQVIGRKLSPLYGMANYADRALHEAELRQLNERIELAYAEAAEAKVSLGDAARALRSLAAGAEDGADDGER